MYTNICLVKIYVVTFEFYAKFWCGLVLGMVNDCNVVTSLFDKFCEGRFFEKLVKKDSFMRLYCTAIDKSKSVMKNY